MTETSRHFNCEPIITRRQMLQRCGTGLGSMGLASLMASEGLLEQSSGATSARGRITDGSEKVSFPSKGEACHSYLFEWRCFTGRYI